MDSRCAARADKLWTSRGQAVPAHRLPTAWPQLAHTPGLARPRV